MQLVDHAIEGVWGKKKINKFVIGEMEKYQITTKLQKWQVSWKFGQLLVLVVLCCVLNFKKMILNLQIRCKSITFSY